MTMTLGATALAGLGGTSILSGIQSYQQGKTEAAYFRKQAENDKQEAKNKAYIEKEKAKQLGASQKNYYAAGNIDVNDGSALQVLAGIEADGEVAAAQAMYGGEVAAWNKTKQAAAARDKGNAGLSSVILGNSSKVWSMLGG